MKVAFLTVVVVIILAVVGGIVWAHYYLPRETTTSEPAVGPISAATSTPAIPQQTAAAIQVIENLVQVNQRYGLPSLRTTPTPRPLTLESTTNSSTLSYFGLTFNVPWIGGISSTAEGSSSVAVIFRNGKRIFLNQMPPFDNQIVQQVSALSSTIQTQFGLETAILSATPEQVTSSTPPIPAALTAILLTIKATTVAFSGPFFQFETPTIHGFQFATATSSSSIYLQFFDNSDTKYSMELPGPQANADFILSSIKTETSTAGRLP